VLSFVIGSGIALFRWYQYSHAEILVELPEIAELEIGERKKLSEFLVHINGTLFDDPFLDTSSLGEHHYSFSYRNDDGIKVKYAFDYQVSDRTAPIVWLGSSYTIVKGTKSDFVHNIMCADNYDATPQCEIVGDYDLNTVGSYSVFFQATDQSGNQMKQPFVLRVVEKSNKTEGTQSTTKTIFSEVVRDYKTDKTQIGLDLSFWQGDVDFQKLKDQGVEFVFLRVGTTKGIDGEFVLDRKFTQNIEAANQVGIPVGIYFYSYANSMEKAKEEARWVLEQIKEYRIDLPIAFDWENWSFYNEFHLSLLGLASMADGFIQTVEEAGYQGMLYSSKSYLEKIWPLHDHNVWLAHYTNQTNYQGNYEFWQMCSDGVISGIQGFVDINIRYLPF